MKDNNFIFINLRYVIDNDIANSKKSHERRFQAI